MKFIRLDLLTLLISLFILAGCKNENVVGLPVGDQQLSGTLLVYDDITVKTDTDNVAQSSGLPKTPLASFNDPALGLTEANIAAALNLPGSTNTTSVAYTVPTGTITTDSVVLELRYADGFYGDSLNTRYKVNVYQLDEQPSASEVYYSNRTWKAKSTLLNNQPNVVYNARPKTAVKILQIVKGAKDTSRTLVPQLRIALNKTFIPGYLFNTASAVTSNPAFQTATNGLYLTLQREQNSQLGGTMMFDLDSSRVNVYYRVNNAGVIDTAVTSLTLGTHAAEVKNKYPNLDNYSPAVKTAFNATTSNDEFFIQGLAGLRAKIGFPNLKNIFGAGTDLKTIAVNRAELVITPKPGSDIPFAPQPLLTLYRLDIAKQRQLLPDANGNSQTALDPRFFGTTAFGGNYLSTKKEYHFLVTGYIQDLLNGKLTDYGTYLGAVDGLSSTGTVMVSPTLQTAGRLIAVGSNKSSPYRIKLNVIYTKNN